MRVYSTYSCWRTCEATSSSRQWARCRQEHSAGGSNTLLTVSAFLSTASSSSKVQYGKYIKAVKRSCVCVCVWYVSSIVLSILYHECSQVSPRSQEKARRLSVKQRANYFSLWKNIHRHHLVHWLATAFTRTSYFLHDTCQSLLSTFIIVLLMSAPSKNCVGEEFVDNIYWTRDKLTENSSHLMFWQWVNCNFYHIIGWPSYLNWS